ncbi:MAG TPA: glutamine--fructose-6-phosphate transaminase (isomerizing), partial [Lachnospiraceae bacterium]|nr:glutamine--fructose-6-phosphate transaminase (isomerizing) [Lachnospiraceae bacterium]
MCGIVGFTGVVQAAPILLDGLARLEYRGYDSAGIAVKRDDTDKIEVVKVKGRLKQLADMTDSGRTVRGFCGIGHTRWATHGEPSVINAHPHHSDDQNVVVVHNGIIENYLELKEKLLKSGYTFYSQTDTEVVTKLLDYYHRKYQGNTLEAIVKVMHRVRGSYALGIMLKDEPGVIYSVRKDSPLIVGKSEEGNFIASDVPAILKYTRSIYYIENMEIVRLSKDQIAFYNIDQEEIEKEPVEIKWDAEAAEKGGYEHFMMKEIQEQPQAVRDTLNSYVKDKKIDLSSVGLTEEEIKNISRLYIVACGSAYHVGMTAKYVIEDLVRIPVEVDLASEFRYRNPVLAEDSLVLIISQSGETADSLAALREAKNRGVRTLAVVNVVGSSIAREADNVFYTLAGPEIAVATTKAYSTQLIACYLLAVQFALVREKIDAKYAEGLVEELATLPDKIAKVLEDKERLQWFSSKFSNVHDIFFIGRGIDYTISMEGSLKMKEISYVHS